MTTPQITTPAAPPDPLAPQPTFRATFYAYLQTLITAFDEANTGFTWTAEQVALVGAARDLAVAYAQRAEDSAIPDVGGYSALHYAAKTAADRVQTGLDKVATGEDRVQTGLDRASANLAAVLAGDATGLDLSSFDEGDVVKVGAGNTLTAGGGTNVQTFTTSGIWTKPTGATFALIEARGGGGGGSSGETEPDGTAANGGGGGGGGGGGVKMLLVSDLGATEIVTIGAGGVGGAEVTTNNTENNLGAAGGDTTFGPHLKAFGCLNFGMNGSTSGDGQDVIGDRNSAADTGSHLNGTKGGNGRSTTDGYSGKPASGGGAGGAGGGGVGTGSTATEGGDGAWDGLLIGGGTAGTIEGDGADATENGASGGGGGGGYSGDAGRGGDGKAGGGGGGGGGARDGYTAGAGGKGGDGWLRVTCW